MAEPQRFAACDHHLPTHLRYVTRENTGILLRVMQIGQADEHYLCSCGVPADWYVTTSAFSEVGITADTTDARESLDKLHASFYRSEQYKESDTERLGREIEEGVNTDETDHHPE